MRNIPPAQEKILRAIAKYKFQTPSHLLRLGVHTKRSNVNASLLALRDSNKPLIAGVEGQVVSRRGRNENMYYLTRWGKDVLIDLGMDEQEIKILSAGSTQFSTDYFHRKSTIDFMIMLDQWADLAESEVIYFDTYFDKTGNNRKSKNLRASTRVDLPHGNYLTPYIIPDGISMIELRDMSHKLFAFEVHNGKDTKKLIKQLRKHIQALSAGSLTYGAVNRCRSLLYDESFTFDKSWRVLVVFEYKSIMEATIRRMNKIDVFKEFEDYFAFKTLDELNTESLTSNWLTCRGELIEIC